MVHVASEPMGDGVGSRGRPRGRWVTTYVAWSLLFTSPLLVWSLLRARVRRWILRTMLSIALPVLKFSARALGLTKTEMDPNARTIEDPVRARPDFTPILTLLHLRSIRSPRPLSCTLCPLLCNAC